MKRFMFVVLVCLFLLTSGVFAETEAWLSTNYSSGFSSSYYRSPVTGGYMDIYLLVDDVNLTDVEFSVVYDVSVIDVLTEYSVMDTISGTHISDVNTVDVGGSWKKTTFTAVADSNDGISIDTVTYLSDAVMRIRLLPTAEGTVALGLWSENSPPYPASYKTCSLRILNGEDGDGNDVEVDYGRKEWNDGVELVTFTDKTEAGIYHYFDYNFGNAISGVLRIDYSDGSFEEFSSSDPNKGITINPYFGAFIVTAQPDASSYKIIFPEYYEEYISINTGRYVSHISPSGFLEIENLFFHTLQASSNDTELIVWCYGIGVDFNAGNFNATIAGGNGGVLTKTFDFAYIDEDRISITIHGGLDVDYYSLYIYKEGLILGQTFFEAMVYQNVIFDINDLAGDPLPDVEVLLPTYGPMGFTTIRKVSDANGQVSFDLPGAEWGRFFDYIVTHDDYSDVLGTIMVYDSNFTEQIVMSPALGVDMVDYAEFSKWWLTQNCAWNNYCEGADRNYDGIVDYEDLLKFVYLWLEDM